MTASGRTKVTVVVSVVVVNVVVLPVVSVVVVTVSVSVIVVVVQVVVVLVVVLVSVIVVVVKVVVVVVFVVVAAGAHFSKPPDVTEVVLGGDVVSPRSFSSDWVTLIAGIKGGFVPLLFSRGQGVVVGTGVDLNSHGVVVVGATGLESLMIFGRDADCTQGGGAGPVPVVLAPGGVVVLAPGGDVDPAFGGGDVDPAFGCAAFGGSPAKGFGG